MKTLQIAIINHTNQHFEYRDIHYPKNYKPELGCSLSLALEYIYDISDDIDRLFDFALDFVLEYLPIEQTFCVFYIDNGGYVAVNSFDHPLPDPTTKKRLQSNLPLTCRKPINVEQIINEMGV